MEPERLDYDLTADSLVWDVGAYRGDFADAIAEKFGCRIVCFEPMHVYASATAKRLEGRATVHAFGLSDRDWTGEMALAGDRTSTFKEAGNSGPMMPVKLRDILQVIDELNARSIDLMKVNIEGGEYALLRRLIESGYIGRIRHLQVQFHTFVPEFGERYLALKKDLQWTHKLAWRNPFIWESWSRR